MIGYQQVGYLLISFLRDAVLLASEWGKNGNLSHSWSMVLTWIWRDLKGSRGFCMAPQFEG